MFWMDKCLKARLKAMQYLRGSTMSTPGTVAERRLAELSENYHMLADMYAKLALNPSTNPSLDHIMGIHEEE